MKPKHILNKMIFD